MKKRDKVIQEARERYERAKDAWSPIYAQAREDLRFSDPTDPKQWPDDVIRERKMAEGGARPCLTFDQTGQFVRQVVNQARRNKPAIKYLPVDDESDPKLAEVLQGLARQTEYASRADVAYINALGQATRGGIGYFRLLMEEVRDAPVKGQQCAKIARIPDFETALPDPDFMEPDGSDAMFGFIEEMIPRARFRKLYKNAQEVDFDSDGWYTKDHVRVCEYFRVVETNRIKVDEREYSEDEYWSLAKEDEEFAKSPKEAKPRRIVEHYKISGEEILEQSIFPGEYVPLFPVLGNEEWEEGKRRLSGCIRTARDAQVTYNFERNAAYEAVALGPKAPWLAANEAIEGNEAFWKQANRGNLAYLPWNHIDDNGNPIPQPSRVQPAGIAVGWAQLAEASKQDIQAALGQYQASIGNNPNQQSGRAVMALQDKADVATYHYVDNLALSIAHCGRVLTQIWPVIYDEEQVIRIIGEDDEPEFVTVSPDSPRAYAEQQMPGGQKRIVINPSVGRYDVRAVVGPAFQTRQVEAAAEIGEIVNGNPQMLALLGDMWVKMRNFPEADKIAKRLKAMLPPQVQQAEAEGEQQQIDPARVQMALQQAAQEIDQLRAELQKAQSGMGKAQLDAQVKLQLAQFDASIQQMQIESAERIAALQADAAHDREELKGLVSMLLQKMQPPPALAGAVAKDMAGS